MSNTITVTWVGPDRNAPDLGKLTRGTTATLPTSILTGPDWTTTEAELAKATKADLEIVATIRGIPFDGATKEDLAKAIAAHLPALPKPVKSEDTTNAN